MSEEDDEGLHEQMQRMKANRRKNANQICDQIYERQYGRLKQEYRSIKESRKSKVKDESYSEKRLAKLESKLTNEHELERSFKKLGAFGFTELINQSAAADPKTAVEEKLKGNYKLAIRKDLPEPIRIAQFASEPVAFHLHKKRDFFPRLQGKQPREVESLQKIKRSIESINEEIEEINSKKNPYLSMFLQKASRNQLSTLLRPVKTIRAN